MAYQYKSPLDKGFKQFKLTKKQHNELFEYRQIKWYDKYEYYYNDKSIILHQFCNKPVVIIEAILLPLTLLIKGFENYKDCMNSIKTLWNQKKYGDFSSDSISNGSEIYNKIMEIIRL